MRGTIARRMVESLQTAAQLSASWETDITDLLAVRQKFLAIEERLGTRVSINAFIAKAIALALQQVPIANASIDGDDIVLHASVNIGVAIALPGNNAIDTQLMVPVLHNVEQLGVVEIDKRMKAMIARAREGKLGADEMSGGTVTLSSTAGIAPPGLSQHAGTELAQRPAGGTQYAHRTARGAARARSWCAPCCRSVRPLIIASSTASPSRVSPAPCTTLLETPELMLA